MSQAKIIEPYLVIPGFDFQPSKELMDAVARTETALQAVSRARSGLDSLKTDLKAKTKELENLRSDAAAAGGSALARARMGLAHDPSDAEPADLPAKLQISALEDEISNIENAIAAAPRLFHSVCAEMTTASASLKHHYRDLVESAVDSWFGQAECALNEALKQLQDVRRKTFLDERNTYGTPLGGRFEEVGALARRASIACSSASKQNYPLVPPPPAPPIRADDGPEMTVRYLEDPKEWQKRREREEREREAADVEKHKRA